MALAPEEGGGGPMMRLLASAPPRVLRALIILQGVHGMFQRERERGRLKCSHESGGDPPKLNARLLESQLTASALLL